MSQNYSNQGQGQEQKENHHKEIKASELSIEDQMSPLTCELKDKDKVKVYIMWRIHNKHYQIGTRIFFNEIAKNLGVGKQAYNLGLEFLEGANLAVNEVIIADKVPSSFIQRYEIKNE